MFEYQLIPIDFRQEYHYGYYGSNVDHYSFRCDSTHTDLSQCQYSYHSNCYHYWDQFGTVCYSPIIGNYHFININIYYDDQVPSVLMVVFGWLMVLIIARVVSIIVMKGSGIQFVTLPLTLQH